MSQLLRDAVEAFLSRQDFDERSAAALRAAEESVQAQVTAGGVSFRHECPVPLQ
jgi:hypothetical protein